MCLFIYMMDLRFWDGCVFNFMIKSGQIRKNLLIMLKAAPVFLGKGREVMDPLVNLAKWPKSMLSGIFQGNQFKSSNQLVHL